MNKLRTILKFDTGADGFMKMIYVLAFCAVVVLLLGIYFIMITFGGNS
jgi:ABC-type multidrug transport system permease subunit